MLQRLGSILAEIERGELNEAEVYGREGLYRTPAPRRVRGGVLCCPICGTRASRFLPFGLARRRNAQCPGCGSLERHRFLWLYLGRGDLLRGRRRVLHVAPEPCLEARLRRRPNLRYRSLDRFNPAADVAADLGALPLPDAAADVILCSHTLEHVPDDRRAMAELARVLAPGGSALILVPYDPSLPATLEAGAGDTPGRRLRAYGHPYHYRAYGRDLEDRLQQAGLTVEPIASTALLTPHQRRKHRINRNHLFHCRRPR